MKLNFKTLGSGFQIILPADDLPVPFIGVHFGMIDKEVDGFYYWCPDKDAITKGSIFPAWVLRAIAEKIDQLNKDNEEEELLKIHYDAKRLDRMNEAAQVNRAERVEKLRLEIEGQKPYSMEELEATKFTRQGEIYLQCDHKFIDSKSCLKCGWTP